MNNCLDAMIGRFHNQGCEFISSNPGKNVGLPEGVFQDVTCVHKGVISFLVTKCIVDSLQFVQVNESNQERLSCTVSQLHVMLAESQKAPSIIEPGQVIDQREIEQ